MPAVGAPAPPPRSGSVAFPAPISQPPLVEAVTAAAPDGRASSRSAERAALQARIAALEARHPQLREGSARPSTSFSPSSLSTGARVPPALAALAAPAWPRVYYHPRLPEYLARTRSLLHTVGISPAAWTSAGSPRLPFWSPTWLAMVRAAPDTPPPTALLEADVDIDRAFCARFRRTLSDGDALVFDSNHRLSRADRDARLAAIPLAERQRRGLIFSDHPAPLPQPSREAEAALAAARAPTSSWRIAMLLADAWNAVDPLYLELVCDGLINGFAIGWRDDPPAPLPRRRANYPSATRSPFSAPVDARLQKRIASGTLLGWFVDPPFSSGAIPVPVGSVPKSSATPGDRRPVIDYSAVGINAACADMYTRFSRFDDYVKFFLDAGPGGLSVGCDKASAYHSLPKRYADWPFGLLYWRGRWAVTPCFDFGLAPASQRWESVSALNLCAMLSAFNASGICRFVDDLKRWVRGGPVMVRAWFALLQFLCLRYGYVLSPGKNEFGDAVSRFIGLLWSSPSLSISVPADKLAKYSACLAECVEACPSVPFKLLESAVGCLAYVARLLRQARYSLAPLFAALAAARRDSSSVVSVVGFPRQCLNLWGVLLRVMPAVWYPFLLQGPHALDPVVLCSDATPRGGDGFGWWIRTLAGPCAYVSGIWSARDRRLHVRGDKAASSTPFTEGRAAVIALASAGTALARKAVELRLDCLPLVLALNGRFSPKPHMRDVILFVTAFEVAHNCTVAAVHIPAELDSSLIPVPCAYTDLADNRPADHLSRRSPDLFRALITSRGFLPASCPSPISRGERFQIPGSALF